MPVHLVVIEMLVYFLSWFLSLFLFYLVLEETSEHILIFIHLICSLFLLPLNFLMMLLQLFLLHLIPMNLPLSIHNCSLVSIDIVQLFLIFLEVIVVLLIDRVFLRFYLTTYRYLSIILFLLSLFLLLLLQLWLLFLSELFQSHLFLLLQDFFSFVVLLFQCSSMELMHMSFLLNYFPPFLLGFSLFLFA